MTIDLWVVGLLCLTSYLAGLLSPFTFEWHPVFRETWGKHMGWVRRVTLERFTFWLAIAALLLSAFALTIEARRSAHLSEYVRCKAKYDQASAKLTAVRAELLQEFVRSTKRVAYTATTGRGDTSEALRRLNATGDEYLYAELPELPREVCGSPED